MCARVARASPGCGIGQVGTNPARGRRWPWWPLPKAGETPPLMDPSFRPCLAKPSGMDPCGLVRGETMESTTVSAENSKTDASVAARTAAIAAAPATAPKATAKPAAKRPAKPKNEPTPAVLKARARAAAPVTATIASYVSWLEANVLGKMTAEQKTLAGISITLYGAYQASPERRSARGL